MTVQQVRELYHSDIIPKKARTEIRVKFAVHFNLYDTYPFQRLIRLDSKKIPSPEQFEFLAKIIPEYYNHYLKNLQP